jgi:hypothetical protein
MSDEMKRLERLVNWLTDEGFGTSWAPLTEAGRCVLFGKGEDAALWLELLVHRCAQEGCDIPENLRTLTKRT